MCKAPCRVATTVDVHTLLIVNTWQSYLQNAKLDMLDSDSAGVRSGEIDATGGSRLLNLRSQPRA